MSGIEDKPFGFEEEEAEMLKNTKVKTKITWKDKLFVPYYSRPDENLMKYNPEFQPYNYFYLIIRGTIESAQIEGYDNVYCQYNFIADEEWSRVSVYFSRDFRPGPANELLNY